MANNPHHLQLSPQTQAGPSTPAPPPRRPQGARRRIIPQGLFIANPDDSDGDGFAAGKQGSPSRPSPATASSTSSGSRMMWGSRSGSPGPVTAASVPIHSGGPALHGRGSIPPPTSRPTIPAPQSSPLPFASSFPSPQPMPPTPTPPTFASIPPQPPPQPDRHLRRAQTSPVPEADARPREPRPSLGSLPFGHVGSSPNRALPALPSPPTHSGQPSPQGISPFKPNSTPLPHQPPVSYSGHSASTSQIPTHSVPRVSGPEDVMSPAGTSDGVRSFEALHRARSGSVQTKIRVQVTTDNEQFTTVDITGMQTAEGIKERVFSKLRFRDDEYANLSLFRTDVDEQPDSTPVTLNSLLQLCQTVGDAKATLKFFVMHTDVSESATATVIPPMNADGYASNADRRAGMLPITTDLDQHPVAPVRTPSRHSKDGSLSSTSEVYDKAGMSASEWSEIAPEEAAEWGQGGASALVATAARQNVNRSIRRRIGSTTSASRSPLTDRSLSASNSSPPLPTPPAALIKVPSLSEVPAATSPTSKDNVEGQVNSWDLASQAGTRKGNATPTPSDGNLLHDPPAQAGSSRSWQDSGLGLNLVDGMDPETAALIAQLQKEEAEASDARRRQLEADEKLAWREQESERTVWERMQEVELENENRRRAQIAQDEIRAREVDEEERRQDEARAAQQAAQTAWDAEQREEMASRGETFARERRNREALWLARGASAESASPAPMLAGRRPSDSFEEASLHHQYPSTNPLFGQAVYTTPRQEHDAQIPIAAQPQGPNEAVRGDSALRRSGYERDGALSRYVETPRRGSREQAGHPGQRILNTGSALSRRQASRPLTIERAESDGLTAHLVNARSMDSLRSSQPQPPVSRPPYQGLPSRSAVTPGPLHDRRQYSEVRYRSPSRDRMQDGRYPDPMSSAPPRVPPLQLNIPQGSSSALVSFPSPHPRSSDSSTWTGYSSAQTSSPPAMGTRKSSYDKYPGSPRPQTMYNQPSPTSGSPRTATVPKRPTTLYNESSPPQTARIAAESSSGSRCPIYGAWRPRHGSTSAVRPQSSPSSAGPCRASYTGLVTEDSESILPYAVPTVSPDEPWLAVGRSRRGESESGSIDTLSVAGTVSSQATTVRPRRNSVEQEEDDSADTARAGDWAAQMRYMIESGQGTYQPPVTNPQDDEDEDEATLFLAGPMPDTKFVTESPKPLHMAPALRPSRSRPNLFVNTAEIIADQANATTPSDSATESEGEGRVQRSRSFRPPKDQPEQWHIRPEPEALYENLDNYFPKIDLDKPIVEGSLSTPTTPASESPRFDASFTLRRLDSPKAEDTVRPLPPPQHPSRVATGFNKAENRKSIRLMAETKRKTLFRNFNFGEDKDKEKEKDKGKDRKDEEKPKRRLSMWGHKIQEVTPSRLSNGQLPTAIPESPAVDGKPATLNWVKGELIGKGSYGRVYIAMNVTTGDMMAVKQVELPATERDRNDRRQLGMIDALKSEIALLKDLYHQNIVAYLGCETSPEYLSIFLEYVAGGTIASIYRAPNQARFEEQLVKFFTAQILEGLAYLHGRHIWHRDLKGDNILVDAAGVCKISDFGISKQTADAYDSFGQATTMKGSVFWMAPEVIHSANERTYSGKVDIWSLGCVVLEMWSGKRPWGEMEQVAAMFELFNKRARPSLPSDIHLSETALDFLNERCLAKDPANRPVARDLLEHPFITDVDPKWSFPGSKIGKAVAKRAPRKIGL